MTKKRRPASASNFNNPTSGCYYTFFWSQYESAKIQVTGGGTEAVLSPTEILGENINVHVIEYIHSGQGILQAGDEEYDLYAGSVFHFSPDVSYRVIPRTDAPLIRHFVHFMGQESGTLIGSSPLRNSIPVTVSKLQPIKMIFESLHNLADTKMQTSRLGELLVQVLVLQITELSISNASSSNYAFDTYQHCRNCIETQYVFINTLAEVAEECGVDSGYLCRLFKRFDNTSPYKLLVQKKMQKASELLTTSGRMVKQVALELGYANQYHFSRVFKNHFGVSPVEFARQRKTSPVI